MRRIKSVTGLSVHRRHVPSLISASGSIDAIYRGDRVDIGENERGEGDGNDPGTRRETGRPRNERRKRRHGEALRRAKERGGRRGGGIHKRGLWPR